MKATVARSEDRFIVDLWDENLNATRSVTITAREGEDGGMELEIAIARALVIISEGEIVIRNKQGDEVTVLLPD
jgi:hypothetical protein